MHGDGHQIYTDGSKLSDNLAGFGYLAVDGDNVLLEGMGHMGQDTHVFQVEILVIHKAVAQVLESWLEGPFTLYSDSRAALGAVAA